MDYQNRTEKFLRNRAKKVYEFIFPKDETVTSMKKYLQFQDAITVSKHADLSDKELAKILFIDPHFFNRKYLLENYMTLTTDQPLSEKRVEVSNFELLADVMEKAKNVEDNINATFQVPTKKEEEKIFEELLLEQEPELPEIPISGPPSPIFSPVSSRPAISPTFFLEEKYKRKGTKSREKERYRRKKERHYVSLPPSPAPRVSTKEYKPLKESPILMSHDIVKITLPIGHTELRAISPSKISKIPVARTKESIESKPKLEWDINLVIESKAGVPGAYKMPMLKQIATQIGVEKPSSLRRADLVKKIREKYKQMS